MPPPADGLPRFTRVETLVHRATSALVLVLVLTGAALYVPSLSVLVGRRPLIAGLHVVAGTLVGLPMAVGLVVSPELRADVRALGRFVPTDRQWLRRKDRRTAGLAVGKFNAGQKLASAVVAGSGLVLIGTGLLLLAPVRLDLPDRVREGATFTHDVFSLGLVALLLGHLWQAWQHPHARAAMRTGVMAADYAEQEHPAWDPAAPARR